VAGRLGSFGGSKGRGSGASGDGEMAWTGTVSVSAITREVAHWGASCRAAVWFCVGFQRGHTALSCNIMHGPGPLR
jgi:hypothetical protein